MSDIKDVDTKNLSNIEDIIDQINMKIRKALKKIEKKCKEQEYELKKSNDLILRELNNLFIDYTVKTYKTVSLV